MVFAFYSSFCKCAKRGRKIRKKMKKLSQFLKSHISGTPEAISLKYPLPLAYSCVKAENNG